MLTGGCLCGGIRYDAGADSFHQSACHCSVCRRASGAQLEWVRLDDGLPRYRGSRSEG
jgi:hypothetical protein